MFSSCETLWALALGIANQRECHGDMIAERTGLWLDP